MLIHVRTRGRPRPLDYEFLGVAPDDFWWRAYHPVTDIERPTILVRSDGAGWQAYISGIVSERIDSTNSAIQFNLVLTGDCGTGEDNALALSVITRSVTSLARMGGQSVPGDLLDKELPADEVERMLAGTEARAAVAVRAADAVRAAYANDAALPPEALSPRPAPEADWFGGLTDPPALEAFATLVTRLLGGHAGSALTLNLVEEATDLAELPDWDGLLGVLCARPGPRLGMAVESLGKDRSPRATDGSERGRHRPPRPMLSQKMLGQKKTLLAASIAAGTLVAIALAIVIWWLTVLR